MHKNIQTHTKLLVVSDTEMYENNGKVYAFSPVLLELEYLLTLFNRIVWIGFNSESKKGNNSFKHISNSKIETIFLNQVGGKKGVDKIDILRSYPLMWRVINKEVKNSKYIYVRAPSNPAVIVIFSSYIYKRKIFWFKYAGNWKGKASNFYKFQRFLLKKLEINSKVTVNGSWEEDGKRIISFENPCLTLEDRLRGKENLKIKTIKGKINYCFVGALNKNKGAALIIEAFKNVKSNKIGELHIVGDGYLRNKLEYMAKELDIPVYFYGSLQKTEVKNIYNLCHFIVLPSKSEGFPKVIGEAMNYGCVPIVSNISCINQYVRNDYNGYLIGVLRIENLLLDIEKSLSISHKEFSLYIERNYKIAKKFTYNYFIERVKKEILNETATKIKND